MQEISNVYVFCYPEYAGGKFIINSLGLSNSSLFQSNKLIERQLNNDFSPKDKINYIVSNICFSKIWGDIGLGDKSLNKFLNNNPFPTKNIFFTSHNTVELEIIINKYPDANIVILTNTKQFIKIRNNSTYIKRRNKLWRNFKKGNLDKSEYNILFPSLTERQFKKFIQLKHNNINYWNCLWFLEESKTINNIISLYKIFNIEEVNKKYLILYYNLWNQSHKKHS